MKIILAGEQYVFVWSVDKRTYFYLSQNVSDLSKSLTHFLRHEENRFLARKFRNKLLHRKYTRVVQANTVERYQSGYRCVYGCILREMLSRAWTSRQSCYWQYLHNNVGNIHSNPGTSRRHIVTDIAQYTTTNCLILFSACLCTCTPRLTIIVITYWFLYEGRIFERGISELINL